MKEHPRLFTGPMVRAILNGSKTQARRVIVPQPPESMNFWNGHEDFTAMVVGVSNWKTDDGRHYWSYGRPWGEGPEFSEVVPRGPEVGDRLWVRETCRAEELPDGKDGIRYLADDEWYPIENSRAAAGRWFMQLRAYGYKGTIGPEHPCKTVPSIHMPRWGCRLMLEVTGVRVERLQDIDEADVLAEGCALNSWPNDQYPQTASFAELWDSLNAKRGYPWESDPWVRVEEFKRCES